MKSPDLLKDWVERHRPAFDTLEPRADLWASIERQLDAPAAIPASQRPTLTATRGGQFNRRAWWQMTAAAVVVFALGYGLRVQTEPAMPGSLARINDVPQATRASAAATEPGEPATFASHSYRNEEPDPAMQAAVLTSNNMSQEAEPADAAPEATESHQQQLVQRLSRLEARYETLLSYHRQRPDHARFTSARPLADEWDHEMAVLDSGYAALRVELTRSANPDEVVEAMTRNLHLRLALLNQQVRALDAMQQRRHHTTRPTPNRPPSVNPDAPTAPEESPGGWHTPSRAPSPAPSLDASNRPAPEHGVVVASTARIVVI